VAAEWDYGSHINVLSHKATIIDEDHFIPYWIYLMERHVYLAQTEEEALQFLKIHNATHLILTEKNFFGLDFSSHMGSDEKFDRRFNMVPLAVPKEPYNSTKLQLLPIQQAGVELSLCGKKYSQFDWFIQSIELELTRPLTKLPHVDKETRTTKIQSNNSFPEIKNALIIAQIEGQTVKLPPSKLYFMGREIPAEGNVFPGVLVLFLIQDEQHPLWAMYLPEIGLNTLVTQLYLLDKESPHFKLIYPAEPHSAEKKQQPPSGAKIWEIHYPPNLSLNPYYLDTTFRDAKLYRSWMLGKE
jgi:hypothetical protein